MSNLYARFYWTEIKGANGQRHTPTVDVNKDGTCTYFGKEPNTLMFEIIKETRDCVKSPDELVGVVQRLSGKYPMYADNNWLCDSIGATPENVMRFIISAKENDAGFYAIKNGMKTLLTSLLEADDEAPMKHFKSFISASLETYC